MRECNHQLDSWGPFSLHTLLLQITVNSNFDRNCRTTVQNNISANEIGLGWFQPTKTLNTHHFESVGISQNILRHIVGTIFRAVHLQIRRRFSVYNVTLFLSNRTDKSVFLVLLGQRGTLCFEMTRPICSSLSRCNTQPMSNCLANCTIINWHYLRASYWSWATKSRESFC